MSHTIPAYNPFMLMIEPEVVLAAVEKSERLSQLNRHLCRPLDRPVINNTAPRAEDDSDSGDDAAAAEPI
jgi:hypothetical protein